MNGDEMQPKPKVGPLPLLVAVVVIVLAVAGIMVMNGSGPAPVQGQVSATVVVDYGNGTVEWYNVTTGNNSVPGVLVAAVGQDGVRMNRSIEGVPYVESIRGAGNNRTVPGLDDTAGRWWTYSINGSAAPGTAQAFAQKDSMVLLVREGQTLRFSFALADGPGGILYASGIEVTVRIDYGNGTVLDRTIATDNYTALGALEAAVGHGNLDITDYGWGMLVNSINGVGTGAQVEGIDDTSNYYWFWYINGDFAYVGADQYVLQDGDVVEWSFEESQW